MSGVYSIQLVVNLLYIPTPSCLRIRWIIATYKEKKYIIQVCNQKYVKYDPTSDVKACDHILFDMLGSISLDCRNLRYYIYMNSKIKKKAFMYNLEDFPLYAFTV